MDNTRALKLGVFSMVFVVLREIPIQAWNSIVAFVFLLERQVDLAPSNLFV